MSITIGELYNPDSKKRRRLSLKYKVFRFFGYNPMLLAFFSKCAFCLKDLTDESVEGVWEQSSITSSSVYVYIEEHKCSCCNQKWRYNRGFSRGNYKFDEDLKREMEIFAPLREKNSRKIELMLNTHNDSKNKD